MDQIVDAQPAHTAPLQMLDAQPILERRADNVWMRAQQARDELYAVLQKVCAREGLNALTLKSGPFVYPMWVKFECWLPKQDRLVTERVSAVIRVEPKPFHQYEWEYNLEINDRGKKKTWVGLWRFNKNDATQLIQYLLRRATEPNFRALQLRQTWLEVWKPPNKIKGLQTDWIVLLPTALGLFGLLMLYWEFPVLFILFLVAAGVAAFFLYRRPAAVRSAGKPQGEPRMLLFVDSWQAVVSGLGRDADALRERFLLALRTPITEHFRCHSERIWYWGLDGKEEREQIVLALGRGILFCRIHQYDQELYVGWDAHLNRGQWMERMLVKGIDRETRELMVVNTVVPGQQQVTEYDLSDLNCLVEWTHAKLSKLVKELMEERKIDQEVDFKILRGQRQRLTDDDQAEGGGSSEMARGLRNLLDRSTRGALRRTA